MTGLEVLRQIKEIDPSIKVINADPQLFRIIIQNLLSNAVKYTGLQGKIELKTSIIKKNKTIQNKKITRDSLLISVKDNGIGIPLSQQSKIFTKFYRADNARNSEAEGTGLGLYIIQSILDQSGGDIIFESAPNKGSAFHILLPLTGMKAKRGTKTIS
jgi:signal transduction histidine kinase